MGGFFGDSARCVSVSYINSSKGVGVMVSAAFS